MSNKKSAPNIKDVLFDVELRSVFVEKEDKKQGSLFPVSFGKIPGFCAVYDIERDHVFSVVAQNYKLITNKEAIDLGGICFEQIFKLIKKQDMQLYNIIMPKKRSFCHIDFTHSKGEFSPFGGDPWMPYIRITNSYNRMFALHFDLGFCRSICMNGVIFGKKNIQFKFHHSRTGKDPEIEFSLRSGEFSNLEAQFIESLKNLKRYHVPPKYIWPLTCKVFGYSIPERPSAKQSEIIEERKQHILELGQQYFKELGETGYAALNVLNDFATRPVGVISTEGSIDLLQRKAGDWIIDFTNAIQKTNFDFDEYLGDYLKLAA